MADLAWIDRISPARLNPRERVIFAITVVLLLVCALKYLYYPKQAERLQLAAQITDATAAFGRLQAQLAEAREQATRLDSKAGTGAEMETKMEGIMAGGSRLSGVLDEVTRLARLKRVEFVSIRPEAINDQGAYLEMALRVDVKARFRELGAYLLALENLPRAVKVKEMRLESNQGLAPFVMAHLDIVTVMSKE